MFDRQIATPRAHNEHVLPLVDAVLDEAGIGIEQVDVFGCGRGPGSFTGVRLAAAVTEGLGLAHRRPVAAVCSLRALACRAPAPGLVDVSVDARMGQLYVARFSLDAGGAQVVLDPALMSPAAALDHLGELAEQRLGSGWPLLDQPPASICEPRARELLWLLGQDLEAGTAELGRHLELPWLDGARHWRKQRT